MRRISTSSTNISRQYFTQFLQGPIPQTSTSITPTHASELDWYLALQEDEETDPLLWWQAHTKEFPVISDMAQDYLTIQATSVPSEQCCAIYSSNKFSLELSNKFQLELERSKHVPIKINQ